MAFATSVAQESGAQDTVEHLIEASVQEKIFPGCSYCLAQGKEIYLNGVKGSQSFTALDEDGEEGRIPITSESVFDVDSLTSSIITTSLLMKAVDGGKIKLTDKVSRHIHGFSTFGKSLIRIEDLIRHRSGLPIGESFYQEFTAIRKEIPFGTAVGRGAAQQVLMQINRMTPRAAPGQVSQYSEVNSLLLGFLLEELWARRLNELAQQFLFQPLGIRQSGFIDHALVRKGDIRPDFRLLVPTEECPWRKRVIRGEVWDENTWAIGGVSGEAGLFANAQDITILVQALLGSYRGVGAPLISPEIVRSFLSFPEEENQWACGWMTTKSAFGIEPPEPFQHSLGAISPSGCAVWFDPQSSVSFVFLSNRAMSGRANRDLSLLLPRLLKAVWGSLLL